MATIIIIVVPLSNRTSAGAAEVYLYTMGYGTSRTRYQVKCNAAVTADTILLSFSCSNVFGIPQKTPSNHIDYVISTGWMVEPLNPTPANCNIGINHLGHIASIFWLSNVKNTLPYYSSFFFK